MITLHHLENSRAHRILWMCEELGIEYQVKYYMRNPETYMAPETLKKIHSLGKSPVITDGERTLAESGLIVEYLRDVYGDESWQFKAGSDDALDEKYWIHFSEGSLMTYMVMQLVFNKIRSARMPWFARPIAKKIASNVEQSFLHPNIKNMLTHINAHLENKTWFVGERLSAADIMMSFPLEAIGSRYPDVDQYQNIKAFVERFQERPAYKKAIEASGGYDYLVSK